MPILNADSAGLLAEEVEGPTGAQGPQGPKGDTGAVLLVLKEIPSNWC